MDLTVDEGSVLALIGANGAGKTTLVGILTTLRLTGRENIDLIGRLHAVGRVERRRRTDELLTRLSLSDVGDRRVGTLPTVLNRFAEARVEVVELGVRRPSLDEVFLALTASSGTLVPE